MNILVLGGTTEAREVAGILQRSGQKITYSLAGKSTSVPAACTIRTGGFGGCSGLTRYLQNSAFDLILDLTHPYAARISQHAVDSARKTALPLWQFHRPPWRQTRRDQWTEFGTLNEIVSATGEFRSPFFSVGASSLEFVDSIPPGQRWLIRCLPQLERPCNRRLTLIESRGPFSEYEETRLMKHHATDVLISKNSGGNAVSAKIAATRVLQIPVMMLARPEIPRGDAEFNRVDKLIEAVLETRV